MCTKSNRLGWSFGPRMARKLFESRERSLERLQRAGDDQDRFREGSLAQIKAEIRCLSLLLMLDISNLRFFESCSLFFPQSNTLGQQLPHLVLVRKNRKTDVFNFQTASQISILYIIWSGTHLDVSLPMSDLDSMILSPPHSVILQSW